MKKRTKTVYMIIGNGRELECQTENEAIEKKDFITNVMNNEIEFIIEERTKTEYEIEKGDKVHWIINDRVIHDRIDEITKIITDIWGDVRYETRQIDGSKRGIAYKKDLFLITG